MAQLVPRPIQSHSENKTFLANIWFQFSLLLIAPLVVITVLYAAIAVTLKLQKKAVAGTSCNANVTSSILVLFYLILTPHSFLHLIPYWRHFSLFYLLSIQFFVCHLSNWVILVDWETFYVSLWQKAEPSASDAEMRRNKSKEDENSTCRKLLTALQEHTEATITEHCTMIF